MQSSNAAHQRQNLRKFYIIDEATGCWNWIGSVSSQGSPITKTYKTTMLAAREVYYLYKNLMREAPQAPKNSRFRCKLGNRLCVCPEHQDIVGVNRHQEQVYPDDLAVKIFLDPRYPKILARAYNVSTSFIGKIKNRHSRKELTYALTRPETGICQKTRDEENAQRNQQKTTRGAGKASAAQPQKNTRLRAGV